MEHTILRELSLAVGAQNVMTDTAHLVCYSYDATGKKALPEAVVRPGNAQETASVLRIANEQRIPVYPRGTGTGMSGGSVPLKGGIALDMSRMNRIIRIDKENAIAELEPGVVLADFQRAVETRGMFYPPDPASAEFCTIGGNIAECAGGLRCIKYGVTRDYVLALEVALPSGEIITTGRGTLKCVTGYDLTRLIVGSEGTLGVVTKITVRLIPLPESVATLAAIFKTDGETLKAALELAASPPLPRAVEFMDVRCMDAIMKHRRMTRPAPEETGAETDAVPAAGEESSAHIKVDAVDEEITDWRTLATMPGGPSLGKAFVKGVAFIATKGQVKREGQGAAEPSTESEPALDRAPLKGRGAVPFGSRNQSQICAQLLDGFSKGQQTGAFLLVEYDGGPTDVHEAIERAKTLLESRGARVCVADSEADREALWDLRRSISPALYSSSARKVGEDICVPRTALQSVLVQMKQIEAECEVPIAVFGHLGDGNLHVNLLLEAGLEETDARVDRAIRRVLETSILNDGTLSGEHGIGIAKAACMPLEVQPVELELMRQIKRLFDPNGILNPGKIFPACW